MYGLRWGSLRALWIIALFIAPGVAGCLDRPVAPVEPQTTNIFVDQIKQTHVDKIDLLFMIDNSSSMADKQDFLAQAVPQLVERLVNPVIDAKTGEPEFEAVKDIHIAVITSSLGGHGGQLCNSESENDHAHLVPTVRPDLGLESYQDKGFLWWDPDGDFGGESDSAKLISTFQAHVKGARENGCGLESSLESWYRFLIDPDPPQTVVVEGNVAQVQGRDEVLLEQRKDFLRPDSLLAVIELTDENDCSIAEGGSSWIVGLAKDDKNNDWHMPLSTSTCDTNPDDICCRSCSADESNGAPDGCGFAVDDPACKAGSHTDESDHVNLRCWQQKKRFGLDFLYPTRRYVDGLKKLRVPDRNGQEVPNPIYTDLANTGRAIRDPDLVFFAAIVGVPWQDVAREDSLAGAGLSYMSADELTKADRWKWLTPECRSVGPDGVCDAWSSTDAPDDPLMIESKAPRTGANPATGATLADSSAGPDANPINGHEWDVVKNDDLQFACQFELPNPKQCSGAKGNCDCDPADVNAEKNPLCQQQDGSYGSLQRRAKGYPGTRHLEVAKDFGENSIVASICPKVPNGSATDPNYGYNPAVNAIIERLKDSLGGKCINRPVEVKPDGTVQCSMVEVTPRAADGTCVCDGSRNRSDSNPDLVSPVFKQLAATGQCGASSASGAACTQDAFCLCTLNPANDAVACKTQETPASDVVGWCYVDPSQEPDQAIAEASQPLVADCNPHRKLRFVGEDTPQPGATTFIACLGAPVSGK